MYEQLINTDDGMDEMGRDGTNLRVKQYSYELNNTASTMDQHCTTRCWNIDLPDKLADSITISLYYTLCHYHLQM